MLVGSPFDSMAKVRNVNCPALFIHGDADRIVPLSLGQKLFEAFPTQAKTFHVVPRGAHNDLTIVAGPQYWEWIRSFLDKPGHDPPTSVQR